MKMTNREKGNILFYALIIYVLAAGIWWVYLLYLKNEDAHSARLDLLWLDMKVQGIATEKAYFEAEEYKLINARYEKQKWMILSEGTVLFLVLIIGIWVVVYSRQREVAVTEQQHNFLLSITHELKSPIASIKLVLQTLQKRKLTQEQTSLFTDNALNDTERLLSLVEEMLLAARLEDGHHYKPDWSLFQPMVQDCVDKVQPKYKGNIQLSVTKDAEKALVNMEIATFSSVVDNLLQNAVKYAPNTELIHVKIYLDKDKLFLEVIDQGLGIPKVERQKIFEKFYRTGSEETRKTKGTGLGLYIVKQVVKAHNGQIQVLANNPQGAIFQVKLPYVLDTSIA